MGFCVQCGERWKSLSWAHCTGCHRTFKSVSGFKKHRVDSGCKNPEDCGMVLRGDIWLSEITSKNIEILRHH